MKLKYQFTMFSKQHRPVSCIVESENGRLGFYSKGADYTKAVEKICAKRGWSGADLVRYGYTTFAVMLADKQ